MSYTSRPRRSDPARQRILEAARAAFAAEGYERATIRAIASAASVNPAMVIRYYGSKEALFAAVSTLDLRIDKLAGVPLDRFGEALVAHVLSLWEDERGGAALVAMARASMSNEAARERIIAQFSSQVGRVFAMMGPEAFKAAPFITTQIVGMAMTRFVWGIPFVVAVPREAVVKQIGATVQRCLDQTLGTSG